MVQFNLRRVRGGAVATVGYVLSPLSWWNDLLVNVPLAYLFATAVGIFDQRLFIPGLIVGYWLTNILGFILLHVGGVEAVTGTKRPYGRRHLVRDVLLSVGYTVVVLVLVSAGWLSYPEGLLP